MSTETEAEAPPRRPLWRRLLLTALGFAAVLLALTAVVYYANSGRMVGRLAAIMKELDEADPNWRLEDLLRSRPDIPLGENSAPRILEIAKSMPPGWADGKKHDALRGVSPPRVLDPQRRAIMDELLGAVPDQRAKARELVRWPRGRYVRSAKHGRARLIGRLLTLDCWQLAMDGRTDEALTSCRACLNLSRALAEELTVSVQPIRVAGAALALGNMERVLALGEASDLALAAAQNDLEREAASTGLALAMRGERALAHKELERIGSGEIRTAELEGLVDFQPEAESGKQEHPAILRLMTTLVAIAERPTHEQIDAEEELNREARGASGRLARTLIPAVSLYSKVGRQGQCAAVAMHVLLAVERYRLKHGHFPADLNKLVPEFLPKVPLDPIDAKPVRYKRTADGVVVYSVGNNRTDDGGKTQDPVSGDVGYRLWDVKQRRQPVLPPGMPP